MATVQKLALMVVQALGPTTKAGQVIQGADAAFAITGCANNGSGLIRVTAANHGLFSGHSVYISGVGGAIEANNTASNPAWTVTRISSSTFDLVGSTFASGYTSGGTGVGALVGSVDSSNVTKERLVDLLNSARNYLYAALANETDPIARASIIAGVSVSATVAFASGIGDKPSNFIEAMLLLDGSGKIIAILPQSALSFTAHLDGPNNPIVYEQATRFNAADPTSVPDGNYALYYYGLTDITLANVRDSTAVEQYNRAYFEILSEIAQLIATEAGSAEINALSRALVRGRRNASSQ